MKKKLLYLVFFSLSVFVLVKTPYLFTKGFRLNKILFPKNYVVTPSNLQVHQNWTEVKGTLDQPFTYLGKGRQSYVFESEDHRYVIKFMRYHKYHKPLWAYASQRFKVNEKKTKVFRKEQKERFQRAILSYEIALNEIPEITGLLFTHLYPTKDRLNQSVSVIDGLGRSHIIPLDQVGFLVQKKAEPLDKVLTALYKEKKYEEVNDLLASFLQMVSYRASKGILNRDFLNGIRNSGFIDNHPIEVDVGSFYKDPSLKEDDLFSLEVGRFAEQLTDFAGKMAPQSIPSLMGEIAQLTQKFSEKEEVAELTD